MRPIHLSLLLVSLSTLLAALPSPAAAVSANEPVLVGDFSPGSEPADLEPSELAVIGDQLYFAGKDPQTGSEPWVSDGSSSGTRRLADLCPGICGSYPGFFASLGDRRILFANGSMLSLDGGGIAPILEDLLFPYHFVQIGDQLYFVASVGGLRQVLRTDGSADGTRPAAEFCPQGSPCQAPEEWSFAGGAFFYTSGFELYRAVPGGSPQALASIQSAKHFTTLGNRVIFAGCGGLGCTAWSSDGTSAGTFRLNPTYYENPSGFLTFGNEVYFVNSPIASDGVAPFHSVPGITASHVNFVAASGSHLFYQDLDTIPGPLLARDLQGASQVLRQEVETVREIGRVGNLLFFEYSSGGPKHLLATDGTTAGTRELGAFESQPGVAFLGKLFFRAVPGDPSRNAGLWYSDGTAAGTAWLAPPRPFPNSSSSELHPLANALFLQPNFGAGDTTLWRIDPQTLAATLVESPRLYLFLDGREVIYATDLDSDPDRLMALRDGSLEVLTNFRVLGEAISEDDHLFFTDLSPGQELWESDGSAAGTREVFDFHPDWQVPCIGYHCPPNLPAAMTPSGDRVFFVGEGATVNEGVLRVWRRGEATTTPLLSLSTQLGAVPHLYPVPGRGMVIFNQDGSLWRSDGSVAGTFPFTSYGSLLTFAGPRLHFTTSQNHASWLWSSDLTAEGTFKISPDGFAATFSSLVAAGDHLFFTGRASRGDGVEIGFSDGTPGGTRWLDLVPGKASSNPSYLFPLADGRVVFAAAADDRGQELWISGGTLESTYRLTDLAPGEDPSNPIPVAERAGRFFFYATNGDTGNELWALDLPPRHPPCPEDRLCLQNGRFDVEVVAHTKDGDFVGKKASGTADSAVFSFFSANNWEMLVKVLDGCAINQKIWVFAATATDVGFTLTVTDRDSGEPKTYTNTLGHPAVAITDTAAFSCR